MPECTSCNYEYQCDWSGNSDGNCPNYKPDVDEVAKMKEKKHE